MLDMVAKKSLAGVAPLGRDRRTLPRYAFTAEAEALDPQSRSKMTARTSDISRGGCYVDTFCPFPRNASVKIRILRRNEHLVADAKVAYSTMGMGMGLCFTALEPGQRRVLDRWIGELSGELPLNFNEMALEKHGNGTEEQPQKTQTASRPPNVAADTAQVLSELIATLVRRGTLNEAEGHGLLRKLCKENPLL